MKFLINLNAILKLIYSDKILIVPLLVLFLFIFTGIFGPFITPHDPMAVTLDKMLIPPVFQKGGDIAFPFGTDQLGRDILSRILLGARASLIVAVCAIILAGAAGSIVGLIAGYISGWADDVVMRVTDAQLSVPLILLAIVVIGIFGANLTTIVIVIAITSWPRYARLVRSETLVLKEEDFVSLSKIAGSSHFRILFRHILPNIIPSLIVLVTLDVPRVILFESALSFLGLGIQPPIPSWGGMIAEGRAYLTLAWWLTTLPGIVLVVTALSANITGDWLRDILDPSLQEF
jgi:peptide/nickel transport system permease protein